MYHGQLSYGNLGRKASREVGQAGVPEWEQVVDDGMSRPFGRLMDTFMRLSLFTNWMYYMMKKPLVYCSQW